MARTVVSVKQWLMGFSIFMKAEGEMVLTTRLTGMCTDFLASEHGLTKTVIIESVVDGLVEQ
jgi:hypothetical protein